MFKFLGKTDKSISFRQYVDPYVINQKEVDEYNALVDKTGVKPVKPITVDYIDYCVFDYEVITNKADIDTQLQSFENMTEEEINNTTRIQPIYSQINDYTNYFGNITDYEGQEFQDACSQYLSYKGL